MNGYIISLSGLETKVYQMGNGFYMSLANVCMEMSTHVPRCNSSISLIQSIIRYKEKFIEVIFLGHHMLKLRYIRNQHPKEVIVLTAITQTKI